MADPETSTDTKTENKSDTATEAPSSGASRPPLAPPSPMEKATDIAARPGFRSPSNKGSKAQKAKKKK